MNEQRSYLSTNIVAAIILSYSAIRAHKSVHQIAELMSSSTTWTAYYSNDFAEVEI